MDARSLTHALDGRWLGSYGLAKCPAHEDRTPSLAISDGERGLLWHCHAGCGQAEVLSSLTQKQLFSARPVASSQIRRPLISDRGRRKRALALWDSTQRLEGTLAAKYLERRRLDADLAAQSDALRFISACPYRDEEGVRYLPSMIALMRDAISGEPCGVHRTPLTASGEKHPIGRRMYGPAGVVMLDPDENVTTGLFITEGIEDGLAVQMTGVRPVWAALSAGAIRRLPVLPGVECLTVLADGDETGRDAALECVTRWREAGKEAWAYSAPPGEDPAEVLT